jgi:hypothetical protein
MADDISKKLSAAKSALAKANAFTKSVEGKTPGMYAPKPAPVMAPKVATPKMPANPQGDVGKELADKARNVAQYGDNVPKMHKGGVVKEDGVVELKKGETVRTPEQEKKLQEKTKKSSSAEKLLGGKKKESSKEDSKSEKKESKKKKHQFKRTIIDHHTDGSHTMTHEHESDPTKNITGAKADLDGVHDGLEENIGEPEEGSAPPTMPAAPAGNPGME